MFNSLSEKLDKALHVLKGHGSITEINVAWKPFIPDNRQWVVCCVLVVDA